MTGMHIQLALALVGISCFGAASVLAVLSLLGPRPWADRWMRWLLPAGLLLLITVLTLRHLNAAGENLTRFDALTGMAILITGAFLAMSRRPRTQGLAGILAPFVTLIMIMGLPTFHARGGMPPGVATLWLHLHIGTALAAYALFCLAAVVALAYLLQDHRLKSKQLDGSLLRLPSLETLDRLMSRQVGGAFALLTISIVLGVFLVRMSGGGDEWLTDPKIVAIFVTWVVYAVLVYMRAIAGRHGRNLALVCLVGLLFLLFGFLGVQNLFDTVHAFGGEEVRR